MIVRTEFHGGCKAGTDHILPGLMHDPEGVAAQIFLGLGITLNDLRAAIVAMILEAE